MTKREVVWLLVRIVGVYLLIHAFWETLEYMVWLANAANMQIRIGLIVRIVFLAILGLYLLKDGRFLFRLLNHEANAGS